MDRVGAQHRVVDGAAGCEPGWCGGRRRVCAWQPAHAIPLCVFVCFVLLYFVLFVVLTAVPRDDGLTLSGEGQPLRLGGRVSYLYCPFVFVCFLVLPAAGGSENQKFVC